MITIRGDTTHFSNVEHLKGLARRRRRGRRKRRRRGEDEEKAAAEQSHTNITRGGEEARPCRRGIPAVTQSNTNTETFFWA